MIVTFASSDIECEGCANAIRKALGAVEGVADVAVDVAQRIVRISYDVDLVSVESLRVRLEHAGFSVQEVVSATE